MLEFVEEIASNLQFSNRKARMAVVTFNDNAAVSFYMDTYTVKKRLVGKIPTIEYTYGGTHTADALRVLREDIFDSRRGDRGRVPNIAFLITDGVSNILPQETIPEAKKIQNAGIHMYAIGVGISKKEELEAIASDPLNLIQVENFKELKNITEDVLDILCKPNKNMVADMPVNSLFGSIGPPCEGEADIVFLLDTTGSVTNTKFQKILAFVDHLMRLVGINDNKIRIGVATFSTGARVDFHLQDYTDAASLTKAILAVKLIPGQTNIAAALQVMREDMFLQKNGDRPGVPNIGILITDGYSNKNYEDTIPEAKRARERGIQIFTIGIGLEDDDEINYIANDKSRVFSTSNFDTLAQMVYDVRDAICRGIIQAPMLDTANQCESNPCQNDGLCIDGDYKFTCKCIGGFHGVHCQLSPSVQDLIGIGCPGKADIAFVIDSSPSVTETNFKLMLQFVANIIKDLGVQVDQNRFSLLTIGSRIDLHFSLMEYMANEAGLLNKLADIEYTPGLSEAALAMNVARRKVFQRLNGDRVEAPNFLVLVSGGYVNVDIDAALTEANKARRSGIKLYAVNIGNTQEEEVRNVVRNSNRIFIAHDYSALHTLSRTVSEVICEDEQP